MFRKDTQFFIDADAELASVKEVVGVPAPWEQEKMQRIFRDERSFARNPA